MKRKVLMTLINRVEPARLRNLLRFWLTVANPPACDAESLLALLAHCAALPAGDAVAYQAHCYRNHSFLIVWAGDELSGFYRDASGQPCVLRLEGAK